MKRSRHAILFVTPFDVDMVAVNVATGSHGFGHVALWGGHVVGTDPIVLDAALGVGVGFRRMSEMTRGVPYVSLYLDDGLGSYVFARAMSKLGCPYDYGGLIRPRYNPGAFTCSGLVCSSLPPQMREACRVPGRPISPNDIARGLGVPPWRPAP